MRNLQTQQVESKPQELPVRPPVDIPPVSWHSVRLLQTPSILTLPTFPKQAVLGSVRT